MEVIKSRYGGLEDLCYMCRTYVAKDMRDKLYGSDGSVSSEQSLIDFVPPEEDDGILDRNHEWNYLGMEGFDND
jgi:hypothetical protein